MQPTLDKVRAGVVLLKNTGISLLDLEGNNRIDECIDVLLDSNLQRFNSLIEQMGYDPKVAGYVLTDAQVQGWGKGDVLYLESLVQGAKGVSKKEGVSYERLQGVPKSRAVGFLYRPPHERVLPALLKYSMLYPDWYEQVEKGTKNVDWLLNVDVNGLQGVLRNLLESKPPNKCNEDYIKNLWKKRGWTKYLYNADRLGECQQADPDGVTKVALAYYNTPDAIENIAKDMLCVMGIDLNVKQLVLDMLQVLPHRKDLQDIDYFKGMIEEDRHIMLRKIFQGVPLLY